MNSPHPLSAASAPTSEQTSPAVLSPNLQSELRTSLLTLPFLAYEQCVRQLLQAMGYADVALAGRTRWRQRTAHGGLDLYASAQTGLTAGTVIVQVKQYLRPVSRRFVDELRGTQLRTDSRHSLLITTSTFSRAARKAAAGDCIAPIRLVDGRELVQWLGTYKIGIRQRRNGTWKVDHDYFQTLRTQYPNPPRQERLPIKTRRREHHLSTETTGEQDTDVSSSEGGHMQWRTHALAGVSALWLLEPIPGAITASNAGVLILLAAFGALLPDLDAEESKIKYLRIGQIRPFVPLSIATHRTFGHRKLLHSLAGLGIVAAIALPLMSFWGWAPSVALLLGYASHIAADACTKHGVPLFYPRSKRYHLLPPRLRFVTGSFAEQLLLPFLTAAVLFFLLYALKLVIRAVLPSVVGI